MQSVSFLILRIRQHTIIKSSNLRNVIINLDHIVINLFKLLIHYGFKLFSVVAREK